MISLKVHEVLEVQKMVVVINITNMPKKFEIYKENKQDCSEKNYL